MNRDCRIYRRSTLLQQGIEEDVLDGLEVLSYEGKDDRFQLVTSGLQLPACSFVSRTDDDVWYLDTGVEFDGGRMYVGEKDFSGMASVVGYVSKASVSRVYEENQRLRGELALARNLIDSLRTSVAGLVGATPMERSSPSPTGQRTDSLELESLGDETNSSDMDLDAL